MKRLSILGLLCVCMLHIYAQKNAKPENYSKALELAVDQMDNEEYAESRKNLISIPKGDTLYTLAQYELSLLNIKTKNYNECVENCKYLLQTPFIEGDRVYSNYGIALDSLGKKEESVAMYNQGIQKYPKSYLLHFNKAVTLESMKRYKEAIEAYQECLINYPSHINANLRLGLLAANEQMYTQALLSFMYAILFTDNKSYKENIVYTAERWASLNIVPKSNGIDFPTHQNFTEIDFLIKNKIALHDNFKDKTKINASLTKQMQIILESLKYDATSNNFWMQFYVPFFKAVQEKNQYTGCMYYCLRGLENKKVSSVVEKNEKKINEFMEFTKNNWFNLFNTRYTNYDGTKQFVTIYYNNNNKISGIGKSNSKQENIGNWNYYFYTGNLLSHGTFNAEGKRDGLWTWYYQDFSTKKEETQYKDGLPNGTHTSFYPNGARKEFGTTKEKQLDGMYYSFTKYGDTVAKIPYKTGLFNGIYISYHENGKKYREIEFVDGNKTGRYIQYFANGTIEYDYTLNNNLIEGELKRFYYNGQLRRMAKYKADKLEGPEITYYQNGKIETQGQYKNNKAVGEWKEYFENGNIASVTMYDENGKLHATRAIYDTDGKLHCNETYKNGTLLSYSYIDKEGKEYYNVKKLTKPQTITVYTPYGIKKSEGEYINDDKNKTWNYYSVYGTVKAKETFDKGKMIDTAYYYYTNGQKRIKEYYEQGEMNGLYVSWYKNGNVESEGFQTKDMKTGTWYNYNIDGTLSSKDYYVNDLMTHSEDYTVTGKLFISYEYDREGNIEKIVYYDTLEMPYHTIEKFHGVETIYYPNSKQIRETITYKNGFKQGPMVKYYANGKREFEGAFELNKRSGEWKWYNPDGKLSKSATYIDGNLHGSLKYYNYNGILTSDVSYEYGQRNGKATYYHENGKVHFVRNYDHEDIQGEQIYYNEQGVIYQIRYYRDDEIIGYSYLDKQGNKLPMKPFNGTGKVLFYYQNGTKSLEWERLNGEVMGAYIRYDMAGNVIDKDTYSYDEALGVSTLYQKPQVPYSNITYYYDELHGKVTYYFDNGAVYLESHYACDLKHGIEKEYNKQGKLVYVRNYYNGLMWSEKKI